MKKFTFYFKSLLVACGLLLGSANAWGQVSTWTYSSTLASNTFGAEFDGSRTGVVKVQLGTSSEASSWKIFNTNNKNRGVCSGTNTRTFDPTNTAIPVTGTFMMVKPTKDVYFTVTVFNGGTKQQIKYADLATPTQSTTLNGGYNINANAEKEITVGKLLAGHTYYIYQNGTTDFAFKSFSATTYENYTIHYVDDSATPVTIKTDRVVSGESLFGASVSAEESDLANIVYNENTYIYKSGNTPITLGTSGNEITLVFKKAPAANVKVKYTANIADVDTEIKDAVNIESAVGATVTATGENLPTYITYSDVKYKYSSGNNPLTVTGDAEDDVITLVYTPAPIYSYEVNAYDGSDNKLANISSGSYVEGDAAVSVAYPRWILSGSTLYSSGSGAFTYSTSFTPDADDYEKKIIYNSGTVSNVAFYSEGEDVEGVSEGDNAARASMGKMGYTEDKDTYKEVTTLTPGKYVLYTRFQNGSGSNNYTFNFKVGGDVVHTYTHAKGTNADTTSDEFTVSTPSTLSFASGGQAIAGVDYFYLVKTAEVATISAAGYATFSSTYPLDLTTANTPAGLTAYYIDKDDLSKNNAPFTTINQTVAAGQGILLKGAANTYNIKVAASGTALPDNALVATNGSAIPEGSYVFAYQNSTYANPGFYYVSADTAPVAAGKAYLNGSLVPKEVKSFIFGDDTATGVEAPVAAEAEEDGVYYNLNGQQVTKDYKGIVIVNGKKYLNK